MDSAGGVDPAVLFGKGELGAHGVGAAADGQDGLDARGLRAGEHRFAIGVEVSGVHVRVGIHQLQRGRNGCGFVHDLWAAGYFSRAPRGTSSRKPASTGLPSGAEAAKIMPLDSTPRSLRGSRFRTTTTLRPTSLSASYAVAIPAT